MCTLHRNVVYTMSHTRSYTVTHTVIYLPHYKHAQTHTHTPQRVPSVTMVPFFLNLTTRVLPFSIPLEVIDIYSLHAVISLVDVEAFLNTDDTPKASE